MRISFNNNIMFNAISLNKDETNRVNNLLHLMEHTALKKEQAKLELFDIFDKHLQKEAKTKSGSLYRQDDFLQRLYLTFWETLENIRGLNTESLLKILNNTKPGRNEVFECCRKGIFSLNKNISDSDNRSVESIISEKDVLKPKSAVSAEERLGKLNEIQELSEVLSKKEQSILTQRASGKTYVQIADKNGVSSTLISCIIKQSIAKIQLNINHLPKEYELFADEFIKAFDLKLTKKQVIDIIIKHINLLEYNIDKLSSNINNTSGLLEIDKKIFILAAIKQPPLFCQKSETINQNVETTSKLLGVDKKIFIQAAIKHPSLFCQKPDTISQNIETTSKSLGVDKKTFTLVAIKNPSLFCRKSKSVVKKVNILKYYKQIQGKKSEHACFCSNSDKKLYYDILAYLIKTQDKLHHALKQNEIIEYLKSQNKVYNIKIPKNKLADEFIEYAYEFSQSNFGKLIFNIVKK